MTANKPFTLNATAPDFTMALPTAASRTSKKRPLPVVQPEQPKIPKTNVEKEGTRRLIVVLEQACLGAAPARGGSAKGLTICNESRIL